MKKISADMENLIPLLIGVWRRYTKEFGPQDKLQTREFRGVVQLVKEMLEHPEKEFFDQPQYLAASLFYQWILHYQEGLSLIGELPDAPKRVLDLCSGAAPFGLAALKHGASEVIALDQSEAALKLAGEICGRYGYPLTARKWKYPSPFPVEGKFDLIICGYTTNILPPEYLKTLMNKLTPNGHLLIVDDSQLEMNHRLLKMRDHFVESGIPVQAPCVWKGACPALARSDTPCYAQRELEKPYIMREIQRAASLHQNSLKMTYLIFRALPSGWPNLPERKLYRVISPPVESAIGKKFYLCGTDGKKSLSSNLTEHEPHARAFDYLRRGELISIEGALEKSTGYVMVQETHITVEAACGKPIPEVYDGQS